MQVTGCCDMLLLVFLQADYERRFLQLCYEGTADISQFRELLRQGVDVNIYNEVDIITKHTMHAHSTGSMHMH